MMLQLNAALALLTFFFIAPIIDTAPVNIPLGNENAETRINFNLDLPNNDTIEIGLFFKLLTKTEPTTTTDDVNDDAGVYEADLKTTTSTSQLDNNYITVEEAIEGFRRDLIKKEMEIAGIIESNHIFYRHFMLEFSDTLQIAIRCTYDSNYEQRSLQITCYEYHEYETERILSNGEIETIKKYEPDYKTDVEILDLKSMKQTYRMNIF